MATVRPAHSSFGHAAPPAAPDPFELVARRFERSGAQLYLWDPVAFAHQCITWTGDQGLTAYQEENLASLATHQRVAVRGPHGLGKTTTNALAIIWFAATREAAGIDWKVVTTAGAWHQLQAYLWPEVHKWVARMRWDRLGLDPWRPERELLTHTLRLRHGSAFAASPKRVELIEGAHADHILFVFDESKAVDDGTFDAAEGALSGTGVALALTQSTPGEPQGRFYDIHQQKPGLTDWHVRHVELSEAVEANRVSAHWAEQRRLQWGEESAIYQNRVLGVFYQTEEDVVIPLSWVEAAQARWHEWNDAGRPKLEGRNILGCDVARGGTDLTVIAHRRENVVIDLAVFKVKDTTKVAHRLRRRMPYQTDLGVIDVIGVGSGVVDLARRWGDRSIIAFNASRKTKRRTRDGLMGFKNQRAAMWWLAREMLDPAFSPTLALPPSDDLAAELSAPKWREVNGKIQVESKDDIRKRLGRSTDHADAALQTLLTDAEFDDPPEDNGGAFAYTDSLTEEDGLVPWEIPTD